MSLNPWQKRPEIDARAIVRDYFPDATDDEIESVLWSKTGWPCFFHGDVATALRSQIAEFWFARMIGVDSCYGCGKAKYVVPGDIMCAECDARMNELNREFGAGVSTAESGG